MGDYVLSFVAMRQKTVCLLLPVLTCKRKMRLLCTGQPCIAVYVSREHLTCNTFFSRDPRNPVARLRSHGSTHSDDITSVHFSKSERAARGKILLSTSSDGLVSISNALEVDEDEAVLHVGNWGCSISQGGWTSNARGTSIWTASDMETFSCWSNEVSPFYPMDVGMILIAMSSWTNFRLWTFATPPCMTMGTLGLLIILSKDIQHKRWKTGSGFSSAPTSWVFLFV